MLISVTSGRCALLWLLPVPMSRVICGLKISSTPIPSLPLSSTVATPGAFLPFDCACATNCSTGRSSTRCGKLRSSSRVGGHYNTVRPHASHVQTASSAGVRASPRRVARCATPTGSAGHAGATANLKLTFHLDHPAEAYHSITISALPTSIAGAPKRRHAALSNVWPSLFFRRTQAYGNRLMTHQFLYKRREFITLLAGAADGGRAPTL